MTNQTPVTTTALICIKEGRKPDCILSPVSTTSVSITIIANTMEEAQRMYSEAIEKAEDTARAYTAPEPKAEEPVKVEKTPEEHIKELKEKPAVQRLIRELEKAQAFAGKSHSKSEFKWIEAEYLYRKNRDKEMALIGDTYALAYHRGYNAAQRKRG